MKCCLFLGRSHSTLPWSGLGFNKSCRNPARCMWIWNRIVFLYGGIDIALSYSYEPQFVQRLFEVVRTLHRTHLFIIDDDTGKIIAEFRPISSVPKKIWWCAENRTQATHRDYTAKKRWSRQQDMRASPTKSDNTSPTINGDVSHKDVSYRISMSNQGKYGVFLKYGYSQIIHFNRMFPSKPSSYWGTSMTMESPIIFPLYPHCPIISQFYSHSIPIQTPKWT